MLLGQHMAALPSLSDPRKFRSLPPNNLQKLDATNKAEHVMMTKKHQESTGGSKCELSQKPREWLKDTVCENLKENTLYRDRTNEPCPVTESGLGEIDNRVWPMEGHHASQLDKLNAVLSESLSKSDGKVVTANSKQVNVVNSSMSVSPVIKTLDVISREKLMGSIANYDDLDVSSSEDSACATYASRFKMWPRDQLDASLLDTQWTGDDSERIGDSSSHKLAGGVPTPADSMSTFKTRAMLSPNRNTDDCVNKPDCNDLMTVAEQWQKETQTKTVDMPVTLFPRQRTESSTDGEDPATFVIPLAKELEKVIPLDDQS